MNEKGAFKGIDTNVAFIMKNRHNFNRQQHGTLQICHIKPLGAETLRKCQSMSNSFRMNSVLGEMLMMCKGTNSDTNWRLSWGDGGSVGKVLVVQA